MYRTVGDNETEFVEVNSDNELPLVGDELDERTHLNEKMFSRIQKVRFQIDITATPAELAQNGSLSTWKLLPHLNKAFKENVALKNRHLAGGEHLAGNLNRCIPMGLEIIQQQNTFPYHMGIKMPGMMDGALHRHGQCVHRVPPATQTMMVGRSVFEPTNIVNQWMYNNLRECTYEDLLQDVKFHPKTGSQAPYATVAVGSLAFEMLQQNLGAQSWAKELQHVEVGLIEDPGRLATVQITEKMGRDIVAKLEPTIKEATEAMINLEDFAVEIVRADAHKNFATPQGIHGAMIGSNVADAKKFNNERMQIAQTFSVECEMKYLLF